MLTSKLITNIKRRVTIPTNQRLLEDEDILEICDNIIMAKIVPELISLRQNYFVVSTDIPLTSGVSEYQIPYRAIGRTLRDLKIKFSDGSKSDLSLCDIEDEHYFSVSETIPASFYFKGDNIVLIPSPTSGITLEIWWEMPPSQLVNDNTAAKVVSSTLTSVTVESLPSAITATVDLDFISSKPGYSIYAYDVPIASIAGTTINFASGLIDDLDISVGDYLSIKETSPIVQIPRECVPFLETLAARRVLQAIGDFEGLKMLGEDEDDNLKQMRRLLEPRIRGEATKIMHRNGLLKGSSYRHRRGVVY